MEKILIAGLGSIGRRHLRNLVALGETEIILLRSHRATLPDDELAGFPLETDLQHALETRRPDAVIIANPTAFHLSIAIPAARTGCAVLLEKPISASLEGLDALEEAVEKSGSKVLAGFQFRFHPCLLRARQLIAAGEIGRLISAHVHFGEYLPSWHPWEDYRQSYAARADLGGGVLLTQCHALDYLPWLIEKDVQAVWGLMAALSDLEVDVEDTVEIGLRFAGGMLAGMHLDYTQQPPSHQIEIVGTRGTILCDLLGGVARIYRAEHQGWEVHLVPEDWERNTMFMDEMRHFLAVARGKAAPACTLENGIRVMQLVDAVQRSHKSGRLISLAG